jgi:hypothetical protein
MRKLRVNLTGALVLSGVLYMTSCKKNSEPVSVETLVTGTNWQLDALYITDSPYVERTNFTSQYYSPCEMNDIYEFKKDSTLSRKRADTITTCMPLNRFMPDDGATWYLDSADTRLLIGKQSFLSTYRYDCKILKLDKKDMELQSNFTDLFGNPSAYIFSFKAQ